MPIRRIMTTVAATGALLSVVAPVGAAAPAITPTYHCRAQSYTYRSGQPRVWASALGPRIRSHQGPDQTLTDNRINALFERNGDNRLLNVTTPYAAGERLSRLLRITVTTAAGQTRSWQIGSGTQNVARFGLKLRHGQALANVNGSPDNTRRTPILTTVVIAGKENCFTTQ